MTKFLSLLILIVSLPVGAAEKPLLIFFGGYASTRAQMAEWSAKVSAKHPQFEVRAIEYPSKSANGKDAVAAAEALLKRLAAEINATPGRDVVIAGHSSGAALSNALASRVSVPQNVRLVALDGYSPSADLQRKFQTTCWSGQNGNAKSRNFNTSKANCGPNFRVYKTTEKGCTSAWCLHFVLVNAKARFDSNWRSEGYKNLEPNLEWLRPVPGVAVESSPVPDGTPTNR